MTLKFRVLSILFKFKAFDSNRHDADIELPNARGEKEEDFKFAVSPNETGNQVIIVSDNRGQHALGYTVRKYSYVPEWVTEWSALVSSIVGGLLTVPWWIEWFQKKKKEKLEREQAERPRIVVS